MVMPDVPNSFVAAVQSGLAKQYDRIILGRVNCSKNIIATAKAFQITYERPKMEPKATQTESDDDVDRMLDEYFEETNSTCSEEHRLYEQGLVEEGSRA